MLHTHHTPMHFKHTDHKHRNIQHVNPIHMHIHTHIIHTHRAYASLLHLSTSPVAGARFATHD